MTKLLEQPECDTQSAIVDLRRASDKRFLEGWLPTILDCIILDPDCGPQQIAQLLCVVRDRNAHILANGIHAPKRPTNTCKCGSTKELKAKTCRPCYIKSRQRPERA